MKVTQQMLEAAMKAAVQAGLIPKQVDEATYLRNWSAMERCLDAALVASDGGASNPRDRRTPSKWRHRPTGNLYDVHLILRDCTNGDRDGTEIVAYGRAGDPEPQFGRARPEFEDRFEPVAATAAL